MSRRLTEDEITEHGISTNHEIMDNGELRFRLVSSDGSCYIRTVAPEKGVWQNSHHHATISETAIVQKGWVAFAEYINEKLVLRKIETGEMFTTKPGVPHNMYLPKNSVIHCVKHGDCSVNDWIASPVLDKLTKSLTEKDLY